MESAESTIIEYDIRGQICPATMLTALREINRHAAALRTGDITLLFLTTNRDSTQTIPEAVANMGFRVQVIPQEGHYLIKVGGND